ncbi:hypothetical protein HY642_03985 [Candidatus Woesearchaeota archaeon]|nr:hypothetical protein [Candidatus Woesearchaeota archaeon]
MTVAGVTFRKISVERKPGATGKIQIKNNVSITDVKKSQLDLGMSKHPALTFAFMFTTDYQPNMASILLEGDVLYIDKQEKVDELEKQWKKDKSVPKEVMVLVLNNVLGRCNIQALILSREMNLPPPIDLPKVTQK